MDILLFLLFFALALSSVLFSVREAFTASRFFALFMFFVFLFGLGQMKIIV